VVNRPGMALGVMMRRNAASHGRCHTRVGDGRCAPGMARVGVAAPGLSQQPFNRCGHLASPSGGRGERAPRDAADGRHSCSPSTSRLQRLPGNSHDVADPNDLARRSRPTPGCAPAPSATGSDACPSVLSGWACMAKAVSLKPVPVPVKPKVAADGVPGECARRCSNIALSCHGALERLRHPEARATCGAQALEAGPPFHVEPARCRTGKAAVEGAGNRGSRRSTTPQSVPASWPRSSSATPRTRRNATDVEGHGGRVSEGSATWPISLGLPRPRRSPLRGMCVAGRPAVPRHAYQPAGK
jgi:hypothetical protein